jgi:hypothetical protein
MVVSKKRTRCAAHTFFPKKLHFQTLLSRLRIFCRSTQKVDRFDSKTIDFLSKRPILCVDRQYLVIWSYVPVTYSFMRELLKNQVFYFLFKSKKVIGITYESVKNGFLFIFTHNEKVTNNHMKSNDEK